MDPRRAPKARPRSERTVLVLAPVVNSLVALFARWGVAPGSVVVVHGALGLVAAVLIVLGALSEPAGRPPAWSAAAVALVIKAVLDNVDGALARATGRVTPLGRYLDTGVDLIVTTGLFAALASVTGAGVAVAGWAASVVILSLDHNMERLYRVPRDPDDEEVPSPRPPPGRIGTAYWLFEGLYRCLLAPQDRWIERADRAAFQRLEGTSYEAAPLDRRLAWSDLYATATVAELGLTSQTLLLAVLLAVGVPAAYPWCVFAMAGWALSTQLLRVPRYRAYRRTPDSDGEGAT